MYLPNGVVTSFGFVEAQAAHGTRESIMAATRPHRERNLPA